MGIAGRLNAAGGCRRCAPSRTNLEHGEYPFAVAYGLAFGECNRAAALRKDGRERSQIGKSKDETPHEARSLSRSGAGAQSRPTDPPWLCDKLGLLMGSRDLFFGILSLFSLSESTCGKSAPEDATKAKASTEVRSVSIAGVDTSALTPREKGDWSSYVSEFLSPCQSVPVSIAQCATEKRDCAKCVPAAKFVLRGVRDGLSREQIEKSYRNRFDADKVKNIALEGSPDKGAPGAPITIVEFADFECPHCGEVAPIFDRLVEQRSSEIRFVFKFFPLPSHTHGELAARAAIAAWKQGKFWEMHHAMFTNQRQLEQTDLDRYAKEIGLDIVRFHAEMQSAETGARIAMDRKQAEIADIQGTPAIFINGRQFDGVQDINDWIALELQIQGVKSQSAPAATRLPAVKSDGGSAEAGAGHEAAGAKGPSK